MKSNKSYLKRLKISKNGKIRGRATGQNHFNAKESRRSQLAKKRGVNFIMTNKSKARFLGHIGKLKVRAEGGKIAEVAAK